MAISIRSLFNRILTTTKPINQVTKANLERKEYGNMVLNLLLKNIRDSLENFKKVPEIRNYLNGCNYRTHQDFGSMLLHRSVFRGFDQLSTDTIVFNGKSYPIHVVDQCRYGDRDENGCIRYMFKVVFPNYGDVQVELSTDDAGKHATKWEHTNRRPIIYYVTVIPPKHQHQPIQIPVKGMVFSMLPHEDYQVK